MIAAIAFAVKPYKVKKSKEKTLITYFIGSKQIFNN